MNYSLFLNCILLSRNPLSIKHIKVDFFILPSLAYERWSFFHKDILKNNNKIKTHKKHKKIENFVLIE